jgi:hypothetical protein
MKSLLAATAAIALFVGSPVFAAENNTLNPDSTKKTDPSVSSKNTNSDGSSVSSGANGTSIGASGSGAAGDSSSGPHNPQDPTASVKPDDSSSK